MNSKEYLEQSESTVSKRWIAQYDRLAGQEVMDLLHAGMGLCTESAEFLDALKKTVYYGKPLDEVNLREELGDILWYVALALRTLDTDFDTEMDRNINKLKLRYPNQFEESRALNRDTDAEYELLGGKKI